MPEEISIRDVYGKTLVELGQENPDIVVLDADLSHSTMTMFFGREFPKRFFNVGIAEQNLVSIAAGLAASGKIPFASTFAVFVPGRSFDQVRMSIAQPDRNVKLVSTHAGISVGEDGMSHQAIEDLALICALPGFSVIIPADAVETAQAVRVAANTRGPFYIRLCRPKVPTVNGANYRFELGKAVGLREGVDTTIFAIGLMVAPAIEAAAILATEGIKCSVINMPTLKPIDEAAIIRAAEKTGAIVCAEEHLLHGGLGSAVARVVVNNCPVPMEFVAINDRYAESGKQGELFEKYGLTAQNIAQAVRGVIKRKTG